MYYTPARRRRSRRTVGAVTLIAIAVLVFAAITTSGFAQPSRPPRAEPAASASATAGSPQAGGSLGAADGYLPGDEVLSAFDTSQPAIANLDPDLLNAIQQATIDAEADGIELVITTGWRSKRYQQQLLDEAVVTYGSLAEARKWVNTPEKSTHVSGDAVDVGYTDADYWLMEHGPDYGLCQTYANEIWHFELMTEPGGTCPAPLSDATAG
jgi:hypothetical protein